MITLAKALGVPFEGAVKLSSYQSRFSNSRLHPVLKIRRPHHGVDYAAAAGTPVMAIGDGVVQYARWIIRVAIQYE